MAAAARPGPSDARVPCPQCGGLIHPIAGRCKHCKADLAAFRSARPAAAAALPALTPVPQQHLLAPPQPTPPPSGYAPAPVAPASTPLVVALHAPRHDESQPILPPRPTGRMRSAEPRAAWKQWPVIVIVLAMLAIAAAVVLMVWPTDAKDDAKVTPPPPAPERMDTNPLGPQGSLPPAQQPAPPADDPWSNRGGGAPNPSPAPAPAPDPNIDPPDPLSDPFGPSNGAAQLSMTILKHACARVMSCGNSDPMFRATCDGFTRLLPATPAPTCAAAQRCISRLDALDCDTAMDLTNPASVMNDIKDCLDAAWSC